VLLSLVGKRYDYAGLLLNLKRSDLGAPLFPIFIGNALPW